MVSPFSGHRCSCYEQMVDPSYEYIHGWYGKGSGSTQMYTGQELCFVSQFATIVRTLYDKTLMLQDIILNRNVILMTFLSQTVVEVVIMGTYGTASEGKKHQNNDICDSEKSKTLGGCPDEVLYIDGLVQDCSNSIANALVLCLFCIKPLTYNVFLASIVGYTVWHFCSSINSYVENSSQKPSSGPFY